MKSTFAVNICLDKGYEGQIQLSQYRHELKAENGTIQGEYTKWVKVCNIQIDLPFKSVNEIIAQTEETQKALQLAAIEKKEAELAALKAAFGQEIQAA